MSIQSQNQEPGAGSRLQSPDYVAHCTPGSHSLAIRNPESFGEPVRVLVVDDESDLLELAKIFLEREGEFIVETNASASNCVEVLKSTQYDVIVSDYQMPGMNGIEFLQAVRTSGNKTPFILFTGKGREDVVIEAINKGVTFYMQKGGEPVAQYAELAHKIRSAVDHYRSDLVLRRTNDVLNAILSASPNGIGLVQNRTFQWVNNALSRMLGYPVSELIGMHLSQLYENDETYRTIGEQIVRELKEAGRSVITTRFIHNQGFAIDCEIHIAPLDKGNLHFGHMIMMSDISRKLAAARELKDIAAFPHLELTPVIELNAAGKITYFNDAAIGDLVKYGNGARLDSFIPNDIHEILANINEAELHSVYRTVEVGHTKFRIHITMSSRFQVARISALPVLE